MELKQIKELMAAMGRSCVKRISYKKDGFELELEREDSGICQSGVDPYQDFNTEARSDAALRRANTRPDMPSSLVPQAAATPKEEIPGTFVTSPMVGTYYASPSPEDPPFVKVGDKIDKNTVVCIVEAMKVMNEVKAGVTGTVAEVLVESGHPVEFGTKLIRINPS